MPKTLDSSNNILIGPKSAGAMPGPACFDLGGLEPTVTDADVVLGFIDPGYFLGGRMRLSKDKGTSAINKIAKRLNISIPEAAYSIKENADRAMQKAILADLAEQGISPNGLSGFMSVVYGGAGATHCCGFASGLRFAQTVISPFSSAFSALGSSMADLLHVYSKLSEITLYEGVSYLSDYAKFNSIVSELVATAQRDIRGEGYPVDDARYYLELIMGNESLQGIRIKSDRLKLSSENDVRDICKKFRTAKKQVGGASQDSKKIVIYTIVLNAVIMMPHHKFEAAELAGQDPRPAYKGEREVFWSPKSGYQKTPVYERELLLPGNVVSGPAIVEAKDTTYVIPANYSLTIDKYSNGIIREVQ